MKHEIKARYPVSSEVVMKMFTDKDFHTKKLEAMGLKKFRILESASKDGEFHVRIERKVPVDAPGVVKKVIPAETTVVNDERWKPASKSGKVTAQPQGVPVEMTCTATMRDEGPGCVVVYAWDVRARIPLIGGALEKFVCSDMDKRIAEETRAAIGLIPQYQ